MWRILRDAVLVYAMTRCFFRCTSVGDALETSKIKDFEAKASIMPLKILHGYFALNSLSYSINRSRLLFVFTNTGVSEIGGNRACLATRREPWLLAVPSCSRDFTSACFSPKSFSVIVKIGSGPELNVTIFLSIRKMLLTNLSMYNVSNNIGMANDLTTPNVTHTRLLAI